jgi:hypothetical protein
VRHVAVDSGVIIAVQICRYCFHVEDSLDLQTGGYYYLLESFFGIFWYFNDVAVNVKILM